MKITAREGGCEEAAPVASDYYIPCNRPAVKVMYSAQDKREYRMCDRCAAHNVTRGMVYRRPYEQGRK